MASRKTKRTGQNGATKWQSEKDALKKIQFHFDMQTRQIKHLRVEAAHSDMNPSDYVRKIVGLPFRTLDRPRVSLSFSESDLRFLAQRYRVEAIDAATIRKRVKEEVEKYLSDA